MLLVFSGLFLLAIVWLIGLSNHHSVNYTQKIVDRDTGEIAYIQPNKTIEASAGGGGVIIFGNSVLLNAGATSKQVSLIKGQLNTYWQKNLAKKYPSVTLVPSSFKSNAGDLRGRLRLGQGDVTVSAEIKLINLYYIQVIIKDSYGSFDSGKLPPDNG